MPKFNMDPNKNPMPTQDPCVRNRNFQEVALGYSEQTAIDEAKRCLNCKNRPCVAGCPDPTTAILCPLLAGLLAEAAPCRLCQSATNRSSRPIPTGSPLMPRVHFSSHCVSCGHTLPQTAGREDER